MTEQEIQLGVRVRWIGNPKRTGVIAPEPCKQSTNGKHGVSFEEAATVLGDPLSLTIPDSAHSQVEDRSIVLGNSHQRKLLVVVHTERGDNMRIISARRASRRERKSNEESN